MLEVQDINDFYLLLFTIFKVRSNGDHKEK